MNKTARPTLAERALALLSPRAALRRMSDRVRFERGFDMADVGRRMQKWSPGNAGPQTEGWSSLSILRGRSRDLLRNNAWASSFVHRVVARMVGTGMRLSIKDGRLKDAWNAWASSRLCDVEQVKNLYTMQSAVMRTTVVSGECLVRKIIDPSMRKQGLVPLRLQVTEPDFLDETKDSIGQRDGSNVQGIDIDQYGAPTAYWMLPNHPGDIGLGYGSSIRVPADQMAHTYRAERAGQRRGIPWLTPIGTTLRMIDDLEDAELERRRQASSFVGAVHDLSADVGTPSPDQSFGAGMVQDIEPGVWEHLSAGKTVTFSTPPAVPDFPPYLKCVLQKAAAGGGMSYEALTGDLSNVSFTSGRMGWIEWQSLVDQWRQELLVMQFLSRVFDWFVEAAELAGIDVSDAPRSPIWLANARPMIDPVAETKAAIEQSKAGGKPPSQWLGEMGMDLADTAEQYRDDLAVWDAMGLGSKFTSDPRRDAALKDQNNDNRNDAEGAD